MDVCEEIPHQESLDDGETFQDSQEAPRGEAVTNAHLTTDDYRIIVTWMEDTTNFEAIHGTGDKPGVGGKPKVRKKDAFKLLADHLTRHTKNTPIRGLTGRSMQQRWRTYLRRFKKTLRARNNKTGLGLTKRELVKKISMPEKLENMCPHFSRMLVLFGEKANVKPMATVEMGVPVQCSSDSGDDSDSSDESRGLTQSPPAAQTEELPPATQTLTQQAKALRSRRTLLAEPMTPVIHLAPQSESASATSGLLSEELEHSQSSTSSQPATDNPPTTPKPSTKGDKWGKSFQQSKRRKTSYDNSKATEVTKAHESRISLSAAYARNSEAKVDYLKEKLKEECRQWTEKHEAEKRQRELEVQQQERDLVERKSLRRHELVLELLRQNKSMNEIESFLEKFG